MTYVTYVFATVFVLLNAYLYARKLYLIVIEVLK